ncbi:unnamed protein product [Ectocarpus sp. 12 AP-2014]
MSCDAIDIPTLVLEFFAGSGGINILASPRFLESHTGSRRVLLPLHDIFHVGKDKDGKAVYTVYRILAKEYKHNTIQGMLCVSLVSGYGVKEAGGSQSVFMRPNDLKKLMTEGTTSIKRNSVVKFKTGMVVRLEDIEHFCDLPIIKKVDLIERHSIGAVCKRDNYKATRGEDNWAHVKQGSLITHMEASVHQLLLPYYRRYRDNKKDPQHFFKAFMEDMIRTCTAHHTNFTDGCGFDDMLDAIAKRNRDRSFPSLQRETRARKKWGVGKLEVGIGGNSTSNRGGGGGGGGGSSSSGDGGRSDDGDDAGSSPRISDPGAGEKKRKRDPVKDALRHVPREKIAAIIF